MADEEYQLGSGNWWRTTPPPPVPESSTSPPPPRISSMGSNNYGWQTDIMDIKTRPNSSSMEAVASVSGNSMVFSDDIVDPRKLQESSGGDLLADPSLQIMGLCLSSQSMDWNPTLFRGGKAEGSFRTMLQEEATSTNFHQDDQWRQKLFVGGNCNNNESSSSINEDYKQIERCQSLNNNFQVDSSATTYSTNPNHALLHGLLVSENQQQQQPPSSFYGYPSSSYASAAGMNNPSSSTNSWSKYPQFLRGSSSPPKQEPSSSPGQLQFSNNAPFWNANSSTINDPRSSFFPSIQSSLPPSSFQDKTKNTFEIRDSMGTSKKNCSDASSKRARPQETTPVAMPAFKVRKEKMGDRITALQQLVSPFGKTDTASVLSEAIEYIKFLHEQVNVLSTPYMKSGGSLHQDSEKSKDQEEPRQDLRSRGLCLVPVSSTFPVTHEPTVDYWNPTFGGTFR